MYKVILAVLAYVISSVCHVCGDVSRASVLVWWHLDHSSCVCASIDVQCTLVVWCCRTAATEETLPGPAADEPSEEGHQRPAERTIHGHHEERMNFCQVSL